VSRSIGCWICIVSFCIGTLHNHSESVSAFYNIGPNPSLVILGFVINNYNKYIVVVSYCFINSIFRSLFHNILTPWVTNVVQDITKPKPKIIHLFAYESAIIITVYTWFDWFLYYNILVSQIDLLLVEIIMDLMMALIITHYYVSYDDIRFDGTRIDTREREKNKNEYDSLL
jgi:hypothetical protein